MKIIKKLGVLLVASLCMITPVYGATLEGVAKNNTTLIPLRTVGEALGAQVNFDAGKQIILITYENQLVVLKPGSTRGTINGEVCTLAVAPQMVDGAVYVPIRFIGEALGAVVGYDKGNLSIVLGDVSKEWQLVQKTAAAQKVSGETFRSETKIIKGKSVSYVIVNMNDANVATRIQTTGNKINQASDLMSLGKSSVLSVNGTYFAAYNGATPYPDGTLVKNGKPLHITDIGCTIGFTPDNEVLIDFVETRVQGYVNDEPSWNSYRMNRATGDESATVIYTPEYGNAVTLEQGRIGVVCQNGKVTKKMSGKVTIPQGGFVLVMSPSRGGHYNIGDAVRYEVTFTPQNTDRSKWANVTEALSAGPSLLIDGKATPLPKEEGFTEAKILTQAAARSFIGTTADNRIIIGTTTASITDMKEIAKALGLQNAMCLDGGASSGIYYKGKYITSPGRQINNCITFSYR